MSKILFVTPNFPPDHTIGTQRIVKFIKYLKRLGWDIYVLTLEKRYYPQQVDYFQFYLPEGLHVIRTPKFDMFYFWNKIKGIFRSEQQSPARIRPEKAVQNSTPAKNSLLGKVKDVFSHFLLYPDQSNGWVFQIFYYTFRLVRQHDIPYVIVSSPPHSLHIPVNFLKRFTNFHYIVDLRDPWARSQWKDKPTKLYEKITTKLDTLFERQTIQKADTILCNTEYLKRELITFYNSKSVTGKTFVITNGYDPELKSEYSQKYPSVINDDGHIVILHTGSIYKNRNPEMLIRGLAQFRDRQPEVASKIHLRFLGRLSSSLTYLFDIIRELNLESNVVFESLIPYSQLMSEMAKADWFLLLQPDTKIQIPAKFFDYILFSKPIWGVVEPDSIGRKVIESTGTGVCSNCNSSRSILDFFYSLAAKGNTSFAGTQPELDKYTIPYLVKKFDRIVKRI